MLGRPLAEISPSSGTGAGSASATGTAIPCVSRRAKDRTEAVRNFIFDFCGVCGGLASMKDIPLVWITFR